MNALKQQTLRIINALLVISVINIVPAYAANSSVQEFKRAVLAATPRHEDIASQQKAVTDYSFVTSSLKKVNGQWRYRQGEPLSGILTTQTYALGLLDIQDLAQAITTAASRNQLEPLYTCQTLSCGRSYAWATEIFGDTLLHGRDVNQYYWFWKSGDKHLAIYLSQRSNQRVHLHYIVLEPEQNKSKASDIHAQSTWQQQGYAMLAFYNNTAPTPAVINQLNVWLASQNAQQILVVGHYHGSVTDNNNQAIALKNASTITEQLTLKSLAATHSVSNLVIRPQLLDAGITAWVEVIAR